MIRTKGFEQHAFSMGSRHSIHLNSSHSPTSASNFKEFVCGENTPPLYVCTICNRGFAQKGNMKIHMRKHTGERPYECPICGVEVLTELYDLRRDGYFCRICSFARPSLSSLKKHLQTHNIGRPYSCKVCNKSFALKGNLKTHIRMHTALEEMIAQLMELHSRHIYAKGGRRSALSPQRLIARHFPSLVPSTGKKKAAQRKCFVCQHTTQKPQKRSETRSREHVNTLYSMLHYNSGVRVSIILLEKFPLNVVQEWQYHRLNYRLTYKFAVSVRYIHESASAVIGNCFPDRKKQWLGVNGIHAAGHLAWKYPLTDF
ncbi:myoneurin [Trichonephila clavipes]|nr:myoneurin [Trichonephila clavipes]